MFQTKLCVRVFVGGMNAAVQPWPTMAEPTSVMLHVGTTLAPLTLERVNQEFGALKGRGNEEVAWYVHPLHTS